MGSLKAPGEDEHLVQQYRESRGKEYAQVQPGYERARCFPCPRAALTQSAQTHKSISFIAHQTQIDYQLRILLGFCHFECIYL